MPATTTSPESTDDVTTSTVPGTHGEDAPPLRRRLRDAPHARRRIASYVGVGVGALAFVLTLLDYGRDVLRGATAISYAQQFFDLQATALMHGRLRVPPGSLGIEGFVVDGRTYSYFGIFPALLRIPVQLVTHEYDGRLTVLSMALAWVVFAVMTTRLFWLVRERMGRPAEPTLLETLLAALFLAAATGGTVLTFDASLPWVYHEVYLWSVASVVGSLYWLLRVLGTADRRSVGWLFAFALIASLTRTTGGWAVCLTTIAAAVWLVSGRLGREQRRSWVGVLLAGVVPLAAGIVVNWLKFRHPYMFPLQNQVFTQLNAHRREVLAQNGGTLATLRFFPSSLVNYFRPDGIRFVDYFPWVTLPGEAAKGYGAELDQSTRTGSVPAFMPLLFLLTAVSIPVLLLRRRASVGIKSLRLVWVGALLMTGGVMAYGYIAYRYTSEFVPLLILGGAVALVALGGWAERLTGRWARLPRVVLVAVVAVLAVFSVVANMVVGYSAAATTYKGPRLESYLSHQVSLSSGDPAWKKLVYASPGLPIGGKADELWIRGDCDALYFNTGEEGDPWSLVQERDTAVVVKAGPKVTPGRYTLLRTTLDDPATVELDVDADRRAQLVITQDGERAPGQFFDLDPLSQIRVGARNRPELGFAEVTATPGGFVGFVQTGGFDGDRPLLGSVERVDDADAAAAGLVVRPADTLPLPLCQRVARAAGIDLDTLD